MKQLLFFAIITFNAMSAIAGSSRDIERWSQAGFGHPEILSFSMQGSSNSSVHFTHKLDLSLVMFRNADWTVEMVKASMTQAAEIYQQCGIRLDKATLVVVDAPEGLVDIDKIWEGRDLAIAERIPDLKKPIIYFVRSSQDGNNAWANPKYFVKNKALQDTAWITAGVNSDSYKYIRDPEYSPIAHEIAHLLGNRAHVGWGINNILGGRPNNTNAEITPEQCRDFKKYRAIKKI